jgi:hypothetical protein
MPMASVEFPAQFRHRIARRMSARVLRQTQVFLRQQAHVD